MLDPPVQDLIETNFRNIQLSFTELKIESMPEIIERLARHSIKEFHNKANLV